MNIAQLEQIVAESWVEKYRPRQLSDLIISDRSRKFLEGIRDGTRKWSHLLFCGIQGCGKTTTAKIIAEELVGGDRLYINASDESGIETVRHKIKGFCETASFLDALKIVILDEADGLTPAGQRALRNVMEEFSGHCRFILTSNKKNSTIPALISRCQEVDLNPPPTEVLKRMIYILQQEGVTYTQNQLGEIADIIKSRYPDIRKIINIISASTFDGVLDLEYSQVQRELVEHVYDLCMKGSLTELRQYLLDNESKFMRDYHGLLKEMFNYVHEEQTDEATKGKYLVILSEHMYRHTFVMDPEINAFAAFVSMSQQ